MLDQFLNRPIFKESQISVLGLCLLVGLVLAALLVSNALIAMKKYAGEYISVTGAASKQINSDEAAWRCSFSRKSAEMSDAYNALKKDLVVVKQYLVDNGFSDKDLDVASITSEANFRRDSEGNSTNDVESYTLRQSITVHGKDVDKIQRVSQAATDLINQGIYFTSEDPQFFYTKLDDLKVDMLGQATQNAKERAQSIAKSTGNRIGVIRSADMGVFQITAPSSTEVSDYGISDTSSKEKKVTAVVNITFSLQ